MTPMLGSLLGILTGLLVCGAVAGVAYFLKRSVDEDQNFLKPVDNLQQGREAASLLTQKIRSCESQVTRLTEDIERLQARIKDTTVEAEARSYTRTLMAKEVILEKLQNKIKEDQLIHQRMVDDLNIIEDATNNNKLLTSDIELISVARRVSESAVGVTHGIMDSKLSDETTNLEEQLRLEKARLDQNHSFATNGDQEFLQISIDERMNQIKNQ